MMIEMAPVIPVIPMTVMSIMTVVAVVSSVSVVIVAIVAIVAIMAVVAAMTVMAIVMIVVFEPVAFERDIFTISVFFPVVANAVGRDEPVAVFPLAGPIALIAGIRLFAA